MASIYFYYNEVLRQSADASSRRCATQFEQGYSSDHTEVPNQQDAEMERLKEQNRTALAATDPKNKPKDSLKENQDGPSRTYGNREAEMAALQPRMNRLVYLSTAAATNLDALARSLGPKE